MYVIPGVLTRHDPIASEQPLLFDVPRSGTHYPNDFRSVAPFKAIHEWVSKHVDEAYGGAPDAGATLLTAMFANAYIDANRNIRDIDPDLIDGEWPEPLEPGDKSTRLGIGLIHRIAAGDIPLYDRKLSVDDVKRRIERYYTPYHDELASILKRYKTQYGRAYHLSCHCMATIGPDYSHDRGKRRAEFCISDRDGTTSGGEFLDVVVQSLRDLGFSVSVNDPFKGAESIRLHGDPQNEIHSLQVEMVRGLYLKDDNFTQNGRLDEVRSKLSAFAKTVTAYVASQCKEERA